MSKAASTLVCSARCASRRSTTTLQLSRRYATESQQQPNMSWAEYLAIRRSKRKWEMAATLPCVLLAFGAGVAYFGNQEMDATKPIMGIDPLFMYGFATVGCAGFGYLMGPTIGSACWRVTHRRTMALIEARDREFHRHIVKHRVDPRAQSPVNPVPDFYGEKIGSLHQYRQWLRDQSRYKKKAHWLDAE